MPSDLTTMIVQAKGPATPGKSAASFAGPAELRAVSLLRRAYAVQIVGRTAWYLTSMIAQRPKSR